MFLLTLRTSRPLRTTIHHSVCTAKQALLSFANDHYEFHQSQPAPTADPTDARRNFVSGNMVSTTSCTHSWLRQLFKSSHCPSVKLAAQQCRPT